VTKIAQNIGQTRRTAQGGFTLVEVIMAAALAGIMFLTAIAGFSNAFSNLQLDRENSRATQILLEKTEMLRIYNWDQIIGRDATTYIPTTFTAPFYPDNSNGGFIYNGTVAITNLVTTASYSNDLRTITITLTWTSGKASRSRSMTTYVSQYGLANYMY
jgi:prepilin-type N-terminal cleavage/methylation domain-containing protein